MAKMYYSEQEAAEKLSTDAGGLARLAGEGRLRVYADGPKKMYRVNEVDALASSAAGSGESGEVELTPADSGDAVLVSDAGEAPAGKDDTVITSEGISIFDEEDLEIEAADPMAKTTIAPSVEDQVSVEGAGSGSGLLNLTRESDDTSLGAEVLEHIDIEGAVPGASSVTAAVEESTMAAAEPAAMEAPTVVEAPDPGAGLYSGLVAAACLIMLVVAGIAVAMMMESSPPYLTAIQGNVPLFLAVAAAVAILLAVIGFFVGKAFASRSAALQRST